MVRVQNGFIVLEANSSEYEQEFFNIQYKNAQKDECSPEWNVELICSCPSGYQKPEIRKRNTSVSFKFLIFSSLRVLYDKYRRLKELQLFS
jgi:hypothetical protein